MNILYQIAINFWYRKKAPDTNLSAYKYDSHRSEIVRYRLLKTPIIYLNNLIQCKEFLNKIIKNCYIYITMLYLNFWVTKLEEYKNAIRLSEPFEGYRRRMS